jgi:hypothetical protein
MTRFTCTSWGNERADDAYIYIHYKGYMGYESGEVPDKCYEQPAGQNKGSMFRVDDE